MCNKARRGVKSRNELIFSLCVFLGAWWFCCYCCCIYNSRSIMKKDPHFSTKLEEWALYKPNRMDLKCQLFLGSLWEANPLERSISQGVKSIFNMNHHTGVFRRGGEGVLTPANSIKEPATKMLVRNVCVRQQVYNDGARKGGRGRERKNESEETRREKKTDRQADFYLSLSKPYGTIVQSQYDCKTPSVPELEQTHFILDHNILIIIPWTQHHHVLNSFSFYEYV